LARVLRLRGEGCVGMDPNGRRDPLSNPQRCVSKNLIPGTLTGF
jgi:hypothetical protein